jgi:hypothetical protein
MPRSPAIETALHTDRTVDITTTGRSSGRRRRIEIWMHPLEDGLFVTGLPGRRGWYANVLADPRFTLHLKESVQADLPARARPVTDPAERRSVLRRVLATLGRAGELEGWVADAPLIEVVLDGEDDR